MHSGYLNSAAYKINELLTTMIFHQSDYIRSVPDVSKVPYPDNYFDTVLLISSLEHLKPNELSTAFSEIHRVLKPGGQIVYGVPIESRFMVFMFYLLGFNIRQHHFSTDIEVYNEANLFFNKIEVIKMRGLLPILPYVYEVGHFMKEDHQS